ncbi:hypothetical protein MtrunA17_Chr3g0112011 [Medicago truncatula]|uniref:Rotundifolia-like protein n=1 Tax=Medicago truncatula TaxID=3880 RepID=A0A072V006_MEDTR|nr:rotundifolia-like protein [Medicago truncatula]RHN68264.1 hypothetical protein MtrunA17_Chr3g0112011 [Medicago truncatula]
MSSSTSAASTCSCSTETAPPFYLDEKWKLSKKESSRSLSSNSSFVNKNSSTHHKKCTFARKCSRLVKEQRARFYIMRRCVVMLICWNDHYSDS